MCGIAGYTTLGTDQTVNPADITNMLDKIVHRGPDGRGHAVYPQVAIGNTRLSIIDIKGGHQPISNEDNSVHVVYNGELYNTPELRAELIQNGHVFRTHSDTEVLVHLYEQEGDAFLKRLNGMFALALYDQRNNRMIIARDRYGVKPLVYSYKNGMLAFASEIKALKCLSHLDLDLDPEALAVFLGLFYIPDPWTIYRGIRKLKPGHYMCLDQEGLKIHEYNDIRFGMNSPRIGREEAEEEILRLLEQGVRRQLLSDVPVGVLLSGGLDSRSVLAAAVNAQGPSTAFTIGFDDPMFDESGPAQNWSRALGSEHHFLNFTEDQLAVDLRSRMQGLDEPYALWCNVATARLSRLISDTGFKVVLSGEGGDELFCGYPTLHAANVGRLYRHIPAFLRKGLIRPLVNALPAGQGRLPIAFMAQNFANADDSDIFRMFFGFKEVVRKPEWPSLLTGSALSMVADHDPFAAFAQYKNKIEGQNLIDALSYLDFKVFLPGCSFTGNDNAYMSSSVESRVPFMDNDLVDFVMKLPADMRFHRTKPKDLLVTALKRYLNDSFPQLGKEATGRYKKAGFEIPIKQWLDRPGFGGLINDILSPTSVERTGFFQSKAVQKILNDQRQGKRNNERVLQVITCLQLFIEEHSA